MLEKQFKSWLLDKYLPGTADTRFNNCEKIERHHGDLDWHYSQDRMESLRGCLTYTRGDERAERRNPSKIPLDGCDLHNNLAMYRHALKLYREFRGAHGAKPPEIAGPRPTPAAEPQSDRPASWPQWNLPSETDLWQLARITIPHIRFLQPDIVRAIVDDNKTRSAKWANALAARDIDSSLYLWERTSCTFPGVRRYAGRTEIAEHRGRTTSTAELPNALAIDDNSYPKEIWSFVFRGRRFANSGPTGYALAHLADHKVYKNRADSEFDTDEQSSVTKATFGLYTSVSNTAYIPASLIRPTDFSPTLRNLIQRKSQDLYGSFCNILPPPASIRNCEAAEWSLAAFDWGEPVGTLDHVPAFLTYRQQEMERLFSARNAPATTSTNTSRPPDGRKRSAWRSIWRGISGNPC
jgi:hypothetical protein